MRYSQEPFHTYNPDSEKNKIEVGYPSLLVYPEYHDCWAEICSWLIAHLMYSLLTHKTITHE